jgi:flavin reductase (DIM6/NTAB) family NADH-FMN oxidoreductase RutF
MTNSISALTGSDAKAIPLSMTSFLSYLVENGHGPVRNPLKALVAPRPIGWISTRSATGSLNLAPYSFFNMLCDTPPLIAFSSGGRKDSLSNAEESGEFVWNLVTRSLAEKMNLTSALVGPEVDEFELAGLTPVPGIAIGTPRVAESPAALECRVTQIVRLAGLDGTEADQWLTIGQVLAVHIREDLMKDGFVDTGAAQPIMRAGYAADYAAINTGSMFQMRRPEPGTP